MSSDGGKGVMPNRHFNILNEFIGFGNPAAPVWFIGVEDGGEGWPDDDATRNTLETAYSQRRLPLTYQTIMESSRPERDGKRQRGTSIYYYMSHVVMGLLRPPGVRVARDLFPELGENVFHVNIFPLAKRRAKDRLPDQCRGLFGLDPDDMAAYRGLVRRTRFGLLRAAWDERREQGPLVTVCFGVNQDPIRDVVQLFGLDGATGRQMGRIVCYPAAHLFVTPFFGHCGRAHGGALTYGDLQRLIESAREYFMNPVAAMAREWKRASQETLI